MAAMTKLLLVVFAIHLTLILLGVADFPGSDLYGFLTAPGEWTASDFLDMIDDLLISVGGLLIIAGTFITKNDLLVFAGIAGIFLSFGLPLAELFSIISAQSDPVVAYVIISPIILLYVVTVIYFWRARD